jgi:hypothetical protein
MPRTATLVAGLAVAATAAVPASSLAQDLPADVDPSRLRATPEAAGAVGSAVPSAAPVIASTVARARGGTVRIALACPAGGPRCDGTLALHDLLVTGEAGRGRVSLAAGERRRVAVRLRRGQRRRTIVVLAHFGSAPIGGVLVRRA